MIQTYPHSHVASTMYIAGDSIHKTNGILTQGVHNLPECTSLDHLNDPKKYKFNHKSMIYHAHKRQAYFEKIFLNNTGNPFRTDKSIVFSTFSYSVQIWQYNPTVQAIEVCVSVSFVLITFVVPPLPQNMMVDRGKFWGQAKQLSVCETVIITIITFIFIIFFKAFF